MITSSVFDVVVVGGGTAGSSLGTALARAGLGVLVVERDQDRSSPKSVQTPMRHEHGNDVVLPNSIPGATATERFLRSGQTGPW